MKDSQNSADVMGAAEGQEAHIPVLKDNNKKQRKTLIKLTIFYIPMFESITILFYLQEKIYYFQKKNQFI
ncbi:MAG: hypothetical protein ACO1N3_04635 [Gammaproteobacteria bacterium]